MIRSVSNKQVPSMYQTPTKGTLGLVYRRDVRLGDNSLMAQMGDVRNPRRRDYAWWSKPSAIFRMHPD
jgi:hypothetical protein